MIVELELAEGIQRQPVLGRSRDVPHDHSGGVDRHHKVCRVLHCVGLPAEDVSDLEKSKTNTFQRRLVTDSDLAKSNNSAIK